MTYKKTNFSLVNFKISHEDCWSKLGLNLPIKVRTVVAKPQPTKGRILGLIEVGVKRSDVFSKFLRKLAMDPSIDRVIEASKIGNARHHYRVLFTERYDRMLASLLEEYMILYKNTLITQGTEEISVVLPSHEVQELKQRLGMLGDLFLFKEKEVDEERYLKFRLSLSEREIRVLKEAFESGYYELPRRTYLFDIARITNLSKSTVEEHLRKAEGKVISSEVFRYL